MAEYKVRDPQGNIRVIQGPDGASDEEIIAQAKRLFGAETPATAAPAPTAATPAAPEVSDLDKLAGSKTGRFVQGLASLPIGALQLGANVGSAINQYIVAPLADALGAEETARFARSKKYDVGKMSNEAVAALEESKRRGMEFYGKDFDLAGLAGGLVGGGAALKGVSVPASVAGKIGQGALVGAGFGALTPVADDPETRGEFFGQKAGQVGVGAAIGAAVPAVAATGKAAGKFIADTKDLFTQRGAEKIAVRFQTDIIGKGNLQPVIQKLRSAQTMVPGSAPTAADALAGLPAGSPIAAQQAITAKTSGGISAQFGQRALDREAARAAALASLEAKEGPARVAALAAANQSGGVRPDIILNQIRAVASKPGNRASAVIQKSMADLARKTRSLVQYNNRIDADDAYTLRKEIGNVIETYSKETSTWDKKLTSGLARDVQKGIDDAIEAAGGGGWKDYLARYAAGRQMVDADIARTELALKPLQKTALPGASDVAGQATGHLPQLLSRPAMLVNAALRLMRLNVEPRIDAVMAQQYLNPQMLADALEKATPAQRQRLIAEFWRQYGRAVTIGAPTTALGEAIGSPDQEVAVGGQ